MATEILHSDRNKTPAQRSINSIRTLSMDAVQKANSGHPGTPVSLAPLAYTIWQKFLNFDPANPIWPNRDRFVLSAGHASMLIYSMIHLAGVKTVGENYSIINEPAVSLDAIKNFRQLDSKTPGHPEYHWTSGVETTTGPLGQGLATSVGMAMAERWLAAYFNRPGFELFKYLSPDKHSVIFTTAFEKHAIHALKLNAIDYLIKPIHFPDLILAVNKAIDSIKFKANYSYLETIYHELRNHNLDLKFNKLAILKGEEYIFIPFSRINYLEGDGNYTKIYTLDGESFHTPKTLKTYEDILPKDLFYRIHKSYLINLNCIKKYNRTDGNMVCLQNNISLSVSKRKAEDFLRTIQSGVTDSD